jgi:DNA-directed RNA polymerase subunit RPC12/RpoP
MTLRCAGCGAVFESKEQLHHHEHKAHGAHAHEQHVCAACGTAFGSREELDSHARVDHVA